ncbi:MAG: dTDP-4-dehydrorhamnose reductase [Deltaproteobacteria bacterium]|nr:dTDP-4-dehydrorhamnose reductase [Deltaproteobacteria bacterium]
MKILITGSDGQLGRELMNQGFRWKHHLLGFSHKELDITRHSRVESIVKTSRPDLIINAAAFTRVDEAETEVDLAFRVNRDGPEILAKTCSYYDIPLIQISTDYVFDGVKNAEYVETDPANPINVYGKSKSEGEQVVRTHLKQHIILRTSWLYGAYGNNFVKTMLRLAREKQSISVVADQHGCPTSAADLAEAVFTIAGLLKKGFWGTYHYCGKGITNWFCFAEAIFKAVRESGEKLSPQVRPVSSDSYPTKARRPVYSALNCERIRARFGISTKPWQESLKIVVKRILSCHFFDDLMK